MGLCLFCPPSTPRQIHGAKSGELFPRESSTWGGVPSLKRGQFFCFLVVGWLVGFSVLGMEPRASQMPGSWSNRRTPSPAQEEMLLISAFFLYAQAPRRGLAEKGEITKKCVLRVRRELRAFLRSSWPGAAQAGQSQLHRMGAEELSNNSGFRLFGTSCQETGRRARASRGRTGF